ncbi:MAG: 16S rRNA (cytosine(1402)-N(4))-methyltransferase RsmH [Planctomycetes bacterium]|nr:16S rRNA (cytosine(1402)-N(4))-methyltransferase RsmH [Planctomycetota bacterium]
MKWPCEKGSSSAGVVAEGEVGVAFEEPRHVPVLVREVLENLRPVPGETFVDATFGLGGHGLALLARLLPGGRLVGIDRDAEVLELARERIGEREGLALVHADFRDLQATLDRAGVRRAHGFLFDLGASSVQFDLPERGFAFSSQGPLDMRMDRESECPTAADLVRDLSEAELEHVFRTYGEERDARRIARAILAARSSEPIETTVRLADVVQGAVRRPRGRIHPATRVFQALRIAVNKELDALEAALPAALSRLAPGGRIGVISFHSLEDRIVKNLFRERAREKDRWSLPFARPLFASQEEVAANPRARSARLRVIVREGRAI